MGTMQWDESLSVGIALIDKQHQTWIQRLNGVSTAIEAMQGPKRIGDALGFLIEYTGTHFETEEKAIAEHGYPEIAQHKAKHEELKATLNDLADQFQEDGATHVLADALNTFLNTWLVTHIQEVDRKFGAFLKEKGVVLG